MTDTTTDAVERIRRSMVGSKTRAGTGPKSERFNGRILYRWSDALAWAKGEAA